MPKVKNVFIQERTLEALGKLEKFAAENKDTVNNLINQAIIDFVKNLKKPE